MSFTDFCQSFSASVVSCLVLVFGCFAGTTQPCCLLCARQCSPSHLELYAAVTKVEAVLFAALLSQLFSPSAPPEGSPDQVPCPAHIL